MTSQNTVGRSYQVTNIITITITTNIITGSGVAGNYVEEVVDLVLVVHGNLRLALVAPDKRSSTLDNSRD